MRNRNIKSRAIVMISILLCAVLIFSMPGMTLAGQFDMSQQEQTLDEAAPKESIPAQELSEPTEANKELGEGFGMADESSAPEQAADPTTVDDTDEAASSLPGDAAAAKATSEDEPMQAPEQQPEAQILSIQPLALTNTEITVSGVVPFGLEAAVEAAVLGQGGTVPDDYASITSLTISGQLNDNDFTFIRDNFWGIVTLDLSDTELTSLGVSALNNDQFGQGVFDNLTTLVLPDSMTTIKDGAVYGCKALRNVNLGNIETIERIGFNNCTLLEAVDLSSLKFVGPDAFGNCEDMTLASGFAPVTVGEEAFKNCKSLGEVDLSNVTSLGVSAFDGCASLTLKPGTGFYSGLTSIPEKAFSQCSSLGEVDLSNMTSLGESAFDGCTDLIFKANTVFDPALTSLPAYVFRDCSSLGEVDLSNMTALGESAFDGCTDLTFKANTVFHPALTSLPAYVFRNCSSLGEVDLSNVTALGEYTFYGCTNLTLKNGTGFNPNLTEIPMYAFYQCKSLSSVDVSNIGTFGMHAFHECDNLTFKEGTRFKDGAVLINSAFHSCVSIGEIDVSNVAKIDVLAFYNCYNLTLKPGTGFNPEMTTVSGFSGCTSLGEVDLTNISVVGGSAFANCVNLTLKPGTGTPNLEAIGDAAFWGCTSFPFEKINWNKVKSVGPLAFMDTSIEEADLSNLSLNVNLIQAFLNCTKLYNVKWPESINVYRSINAFRNCALDFSNGYPTGITASNVRDIASNQTPKVFFSIDKTQETLEKGSAFTSPVASAHTLTGTDYAAMLANPANSVWLKSGLSAPVITESITFDDGSGAVGVTSVDTGKVGTYKIKYSIPDTFYADAHERIYTLKVVVPVTGVSLDKTTLAMNAGDRRTLTATVAPPAATNKEVTWRSSNSAVATVGAKGNVTAVGNGTAIITVTTADGGYRATCTVAVTTRVTGVVLGRNNATLDSDDTLQLLAAVSPATASNKAVSWKSSNPKVATVDTNGKVIAVGAGTAEITVTTAEGGYHATCMVTVTKQESPLILNVRIPEWIELGKNNPGVSILATVENGQNTTFQWYKDENPIANETSATLYVSGEMGVGSYYVTVSADGGATYAKSNVCRVEWSANEGTVVVIVDQPVSAPPATLDDPKAVADAVLIEDEKQLLKDTNVNLTLTLKVVAQPQPPKQDENAVLHVVDHENAELGMFLDIQLLKEIMDETGKILLSDNVMQATQKLRITIEIPEDLRGHESYFIVRVHDGKTDILVDLDTDPNTITFETDRFSTYALVYESHNSSGGNTNADAGTSDATARSTPQTGDDSSQMLAVYSLLSIISGICIWVALMRKKRGWKR